MLTFANVTKSFGAVRALRGVSFDVREGEVHALVGENGAGKSTLLKILAGILRPDAGSLSWCGEPLVFTSPRHALERGIGMVYQEMLAFPNLSVAANIFAGRELTTRAGRLDERTMHARTRVLLDDLKIPVQPDTPMEDLPAALAQLVQVARALAFDCKVLVLDEPTTSLTDAEGAHLFAVVNALTARGLTVLFVSHRIPEVFRICDRITVLRDGACVGTFDRADVAPDAIVKAMVGRKIEEHLGIRASGNLGMGGSGDRGPGGSGYRGPGGSGDRGIASGASVARLRVRGLSRPPRFHDVNLEVGAGEIVAIFGLVGSGRSDLLESIFGVRAAAAGRVEVDGDLVHLRSARDGARAGLSFVPEDRQRQGLFFALSQRDNIAIASAEKRGAARVDHAAEAVLCDTQRRTLAIKTPSLDATPDTLSGGNQQKIVVAKWLATAPRVLLLDEPTKGVDVGAKFEIHQIIRDQVAQGMACLMVSSDLPEVLALADRILVMREGRITGELRGAAATEDAVMHMATHEATA